MKKAPPKRCSFTGLFRLEPDTELEVIRTGMNRAVFTVFQIDEVFLCIIDIVLQGHVVCAVSYKGFLHRHAGIRIGITLKGTVNVGNNAEVAVGFALTHAVHIQLPGIGGKEYLGKGVAAVDALVGAFVEAVITKDKFVATRMCDLILSDHIVVDVTKNHGKVAGDFLPNDPDMNLHIFDGAVVEILRPFKVEGNDRPFIVKMQIADGRKVLAVIGVGNVELLPFIKIGMDESMP